MDTVQMKKSYLYITFVFSVLISLGVAASWADVPASQIKEVRHLLNFVETTDCTFERNGKKYNSEEASKHIKRKYKHYRSQITTTEEFIEYSATKSTMSGKDYLVYCESDTPIKSKDWLLEELRVYRNNQAEQ